MLVRQTDSIGIARVVALVVLLSPLLLLLLLPPPPLPRPLHFRLLPQHNDNSKHERER